MVKQIIIILLFTIAVNIQAQEATKVDPYHKNTNGFGYSIMDDAFCNIWWAEGAYKVMRDMPAPSRQSPGIQIWSAKNEYESFLLVVNPKVRLENFRIHLNEITGSKGNSIGKENITIRKVEYVRVTKPTDSYGFTGWWPDPLPLVNNPTTLIPSENQPFWVTVKVPENALAGEYSGRIRLSSGTWTLDIPVYLYVWNFSLPKSPAIRSGFGMNMNDIAEYENLTEMADKQRVFEYYMESFHDYKISPYDPFLYNPVREKISGVAWQGGFFDSHEKWSGNYSYKLVDNSLIKNTEGSMKDFVPVKNQSTLKLEFHARSLKEKQPFVVGIECYNVEKELIVFENRFEIFTGETNWKDYSMNLGKFNPEVAHIKIKLFPSNRTKAGEDTGTVWFDELRLINESGQNEFPEGDFETDLNKIDINLDFSDFNKAGKKYFDEFGFTGYSLSLKGLGGGTYYSRESGVFEGFEQGTSEYNKLKGILIWSTTYWNSEAASPAGYLQNPWEEAMSYVTGYGWPLGKQTIWGNGDGRLFYPSNRNPDTDTRTYAERPVPSLRLEFLRDGIEDFEYFSLLGKAIAKNPSHRLAKEVKKLLDIPATIYTNEKTYSKNPQDMLEYRKKIAEMLVALTNGEHK